MHYIHTKLVYTYSLTIFLTASSNLCSPEEFADNRVCCFFVAGGRGKDGAPIITFPEYSGFSEVPEEDFLNVITYLTSIPRYFWTD